MSQNEINTALDNAEASLRMEGLSVSEQTRSLCQKLLQQEITIADYLSHVKKKAGLSL